jgi:hypothetical protein
MASQPAPPPSCAVVEVLDRVLAGDAIYDAQAGASHVLVPTAIRVRFANLRPRARVLAVPKNALPFGLLTGLRLEGGPFTGDGLAPDLSVTVHVTKATGVCEVALRGPTWAADVGVGSPLAKAEDVADVDMRAVRAATGHVMAWRAVSAGAVGDITLTLNGSADTPPTFDLVYLGVNGVPVNTPPPPARPQLLLPPMHERVRLAKLREREAGGSEGPASQ